MEKISEYDAFGPWIYQVLATDDIPRLYRTAEIDPASYRLVLKVPRSIERRNATPDMHLYDHLLLAGQESLTVLSRTGDTYETTEIPFDEIASIENSVSLLDGRLTIQTTGGGSTTIPYNASSGSSAQDLVEILRQEYLPAVESREVSSETTGQHLPNLGDKDIALVAAYRTLIHQEPRARLVGLVTRHSIPPATGKPGQLLQWVWPVTLHASITVTDDREVQVIHRRDWFTHGYSSVYSVARTVFPLSRVSAVHVHPHSRYEQVQVISVISGEAAFKIPARTGSDVDSFLAAFTTSR
jgi:hypothetical protein